MKTIVTLVFVLFIGVAAQAQSTTHTTANAKVVTLEMGIVKSTVSVKMSQEKNTKVARLYKFKYSRIKKALKFTTKRNKAKMA